MNTVVTEAVEIPGYRIVKAIGVGGMASVYLAVQESLDREVALKVMAPTLAENAEFADRFLKEGRLCAKLSHPNLVTVYDIGQYGQVYYLAQEYIPGGTLREKMNAGMTVPEILDVVRDVAQGLAYAHEKGVVHRDVKPGNVLFRANGTAVLADFGIAKAMDSKTMSTQAGNSIGTPHYMSPEQARAEKVDGRSDLYSLGAMLFEMLVGTPPYDATDPFSIALMHVTHPVPQLPPNVAWLQPLIEKLMAKLPQSRFATGDELITGCDKLFAVAPEAQVLRDAHMTRKRSVVRPIAEQPTEAYTKDSADTPRSLPVAVRNASAAKNSSSIDTWRRFGKPLSALLTGLAAIAIVALLVWRSSDRDTTVTNQQTLQTTDISTTPVQQPSELPQENAGVSLGEQGNGEIVDLGNEISNDDQSPELLIQGDVGTLLAKAREYVETGLANNGRRFTSPPGDSAVDIYNAVLRQDPGNVDASNGLERIADYYESKARSVFDRGIVTGCAMLAEQGLKAAPKRPSLLDLRDRQCKLAQ
jgi:serine/threonine-protein kinase PpkA